MTSVLLIFCFLGFVLPAGKAAPLTTLEYRINGTGLQVSPVAVSVPKGIAGSVLVTLTGGEATQALAEGAYVEAFLRGPGFPEPRRLVGAVNQPMLFPPLNLVGDYQLDSIRLVDAATGGTRMEGSPRSVPVKVFDEILVSRVTSRPLTYEEIEEKGIFIDESNFRVVEFEAAFVLDGKTIPISFPVVSPKFTQSVELIPAAELEEKLAAAAVLNQQISATTTLPPEFEVSQLNIQVQGINFQVVDPDEPESLGLKVPPIPALMVIPGNIGYLNQFFSVQIFTENAAPRGSGLSVYDIKATLKLPAGPDRVPATEYAVPGDDPLRFARIGPDKLIQPIQAIVQPGADGEVGTPDDGVRLQPGQSGQAEFLVEGLQEGLHVMDLDLEATMDGLAAGPVTVKGKAAGSVLVRNPRFSMAFSHPRTVRVGEPYEASVTLLNTGITPANLVQISLNKNSISGAVLMDEAQQTVELGTLLPGQSATATFRLRSLRNGAVSFSNLTTSDDSVVGRFRLSIGVDERGVALSPDTLAMPDQVQTLPADLIFAANRVLGQALSVATAGQLPPGVLRVGKGIITRRVLDLAEAGQRLGYGDPARRVYADLLRDWQGGRESNAGFDQIMRETEAGREWRDALFAAMEAADGLTATERLVDRAADYAGLGQAFGVGSADSGQLQLSLGDTNATETASLIPYSLVYGGTNGTWANFARSSNVVLTWTFTNGPPSAQLAVVLVATNGTAQQLRWTIAAPPENARYRFAVMDGNTSLEVDADGDGVVDSQQAATVTAIRELPPTLVAVEQDLKVQAGRGSNPCIGPEDYFNYGTVVAVVFSKPMTQEAAGDPESYQVEGDNGANSVQVQPGGRVAYLNLRKGISAIIPRKLSLSGVVDARGNALTAEPRLIRSVEPGTEVPFQEGVAIRGRALKGDGSPAVGIPVTLTMYDRSWSRDECENWTRRVSQVFTDAGGNFDFDFVMAGIPYSVSATDTSGLSDEALTLIAGNTAEGEVERERILQLATASASRDSLLSILGTASIPEAIAKVEGLDRALIRDTVTMGGPREGQTVPMALRFRGRATVVGQVVAADGVTPVPRPAVNLFPDSASRELGRGIFADAQGRFAFYGVPLGVYTIEVATSDRRTRTIAGLLDTPGQVSAVTIELPNTETPVGSLQGTVFEADNQTPHAGARIFIGEVSGSQVKNVVRIVEADAEGNWRADNLPAQRFDVVAISFDGQRKGTRLDFTVAAGALSVANLSLEATTELLGRVQFEDGRPAANALVAGGLTLVRTDADGLFSLSGVPVGRRTISAGVERNPEAGIDFPRLGSSIVNVVAGANNYVVVKLRAAGRIFGRVTDLNGAGIGGIRVAIPMGEGFFWTDADGQGNYSFENLNLGNYTLSAPANATSPTLNVSQLNEQIRSGNEDEILAAFEEAIRVFVGAEDPLITGEQRNFRPITWGFTTTRLQFDGQSVQANIRMLREGSVSGRVVNHQGVPIGARVRLTGLGPAIDGAPKITIRGERDTDPATGEFVFPGQLLVGPWTVQAASPFYPTVISEGGVTTEIDPNVIGLQLQFPSIRDFNGRLVGRVLLPNGLPAGEGIRVKINFSDDYEIRTGTNGFFDTQIAVPARTYRAEAIDAVSGLRGEAYATVTAGQTNQVDIRLLTKDSVVEVTVLRGNGLPAAGAQVDLEQGTYPREGRLTAFADANGRVTFSNLWEGRYAVCAQYTESSTRVSARGGVTVGAEQSVPITLRLGGTGIIEGRFVRVDQVTPVEGAQVSVGNLGFASTDATGRFRFEGVPLGTHVLQSSEPVTGAVARGSATVSVADEVVNALLIEGARGEINGYVLDSYGQDFAAGAVVTVTYSDGLTPRRTVTTGPDGRFSFPGSPVGAFSLSARDRPVSEGGRGTTGSASGTLSAATLVASVDVALRPLGTLPVLVVRADGTTPAPNVTVRLGGREADTDATGSVRFENLTLGNYTLTAISRNGGELRNGTRMGTTLTQAGTNPPVTLILPGVGEVSGQVVGSNGTTPISGAEVVIEFQAPVFSGQRVTAVSGADGSFAFGDVPVGNYRLTASSLSLASTVSGAISAAGEADTLTLRLGDSGSLLGRLVRADGVTPVGNIDVLATFDSQSANPGRAFVRTELDGTFEFFNLPIGEVDLEAVAADFGGVALRKTRLTSNGESLEVGDLRLDEDFPTVLSVVPANTSEEVPTTAVVELEFSEALRADTVTPEGVFIRAVQGGAKVAAQLQLLETNGVPRRVRLTPNAPLVSEQVYEVVVIAGDVFNAGGRVVGTGPLDLVNRSLVTPFVSRFRTADNDPPILLSQFPTNGAVQIDPRSVPRLSFNETLQPGGISFRVSGPEGVVSGTTSVGVDGRVLGFVPTDVLRANTTYTLTVSNVFDLAGNRSAGEPFVATFATLDTVGPMLASLRVADGRQTVAGAVVPVEAVLATAETGVQVRFSQDFGALGSATNLPFRIPVTLPLSGTTTVRAIATDQYGNDGPVAELVITVLPNQPPTLVFTRVSPTTGAAPTGSFVAVDVEAVDDASVSELKAIVAGIGTGELSRTNSTRLRVQGFVNSQAGPGSQVQIFAEAIDNLGQSSGQQVFTLEISDAARPNVAILSPTNGARVSVGEPLPVVVQVVDNFTNATVSVALSGALATNQTVTVPLISNQPATNAVFFSLTGLPEDGAPVQAVVTVTDDAGNSTNATVVFRLVDASIPVVQTILPANQSDLIAVRPRVVATFSEPLDPESVSAASFRVVGEEGQVPGEVTLSGTNQVVIWYPAGALRFGQEYTVSLTEVMTDRNGNPITPFVSTFRVAPFAITQPTNGTPVVEGQEVAFAAGGPNPEGIEVVRYRLGAGQTNAPRTNFVSSLFVPLLANLSGDSAVLEAMALIGGTNLARDTVATARSSSTEFGGPPSRIVDGNRSGEWGTGSVAHTGFELHPWFEIDLGRVLALNRVGVYFRSDNAQQSAVAVLVAATPFERDDFLAAELPATYRNGAVEIFRTANGQALGGVEIPTDAVGRYIRVVHLGQNYLTIAEVEAYGAMVESPLAPVALQVFSRSADSDGDGLSNGQEIDQGSNPFQADKLPVIGIPDTLELVAGTTRQISVQVTDADGNVRSLEVAELDSESSGKAEFWNSAVGLGNLAGLPLINPPNYTTNFTELNYPYGTEPWFPGGQVDQFGARFTGTLIVPQSGDYTFTLNSDDGSRLSLDDRIVVDFDGAHGASDRSAVQSLTAGSYSLTALYFEAGGGAQFIASWSGPGFERRPLNRSDFGRFAVLRFAETGTRVTNSPIDLATLSATLELRSERLDPGSLVFTARDAGGLTARKVVSVVTLADQDRDGVPDRDDPDRDGDGVSNAEELIAGTNPDRADTDGDGTPDGLDGNALQANRLPVAGAGGAFRFDGVDDVLMVTNAASLRFGGDLTIEFWIYPENTTTVQTVITKAYAGEGGMALLNNGQLRYHYGNLGVDGGSPNSNYQYLDLGRPLLRRVWTHVALVRDLTQGRLRWYLNGELVAEVAVTLPAIPGDQPFQIGNGWAGPFVGELDEVRVWSVARTATEIAAGVGTRVVGNEAGLAAAWSFEGSFPGLTRDSTGREAHARLGNPFIPGGSPMAVESSVWETSLVRMETREELPVTVRLTGTDADNVPVRAQVLTLPELGELYQTADGVTRGSLIDAVPALVTDAQNRVIFVSKPGEAGSMTFRYAVSDGQDSSFPSTVEVQVLPTNTVPVAGADTLALFQETPTPLTTLLQNDTDADGDSLLAIPTSRPQHGTLIQNGEGQWVYTPNAGFSGVDTFRYLLVDSFSWNRERDFRPGTVNFTREGNPSRDQLGLVTWRYDYFVGGPLTEEVPWFQEIPGQLIWDPNWFNSGGLWAFQDNFGTAISSEGVSHNIQTGGWYDSIPAVTWIAPAAMPLDVVGELELEWNGSGQVAAAVDVDLVIARRRYADGVVTPLYTNTVSKPNPASSLVETLILPVSLRNIDMALGDELILSYRGRAAVASRWLTLYDRLYLVPAEPSREATVTLNVGANSVPVAQAHPTNGALRFDGNNDFLRFGNNFSGFPSGDLTVEFWMKSTNTAKAGTMLSYSFGGQDNELLLINTLNMDMYVAGGSRGLGVGVVTGDWIHVAISRSQADGMTRVYLDGVLVASNTVIPGAGFRDGGILVFGQDQDGPGGGFDPNQAFAGELDELRLWNRVRTEEEIASYRWVKTVGTEPGLVAGWNFDEPSGLEITNLVTGVAGGLLGHGNVDQAPERIVDFAPFDVAYLTAEETAVAVTLAATDADNDPLTTTVTRLPAHGTLYQTEDGVTASGALGGGRARRFDGVNDVITVPENSAGNLSGQAQWTISAWIRPRAATRAFPVIYSEGFWGLTLGLQSGSGRLDSWVNDTAQIISDRAVTFGEWQHVAVTSDGTNRRFYINGQPAGVGSAPLATSDGMGAAIGGVITELGSNRNRFDGDIDEVAIWSRALSAAEMLDLAGRAMTGTESGLMAWWNLDEDSRTVVTDATGRGVVGVAGGGNPAGNDQWVPSIILETSRGSVAPSVTNSERKLIYVPDPEWAGLDEFSYRANDGKVDSMEAVVFVRTFAVDDLPLVVPDSVAAILGFDQVIPSVLVNDTDAEGDSLSLEDFTLPANGTLTSLGGGVFRYRANPGFTGVDTFTYRVTDGNSISLPGTVTITVTAPGQFRWVNAAGGNWSNPANWSANRVPTAADDVFIDEPGTYTVVLDQNAAIRRLVLGGTSGRQTLSLVNRTLTTATDSFVLAQGTLAQAGGSINAAGVYWTVSGEWAWSGGNWTGVGTTELTAEATAAFTGAANKILNDGRRVLNRGTVNVLGGTLMLANSAVAGATLENLGTLVLDSEADFLWSNSSSARPVLFRNSGIWRKTGAGTSRVSVPFESTGTLEITGGILQTESNGQMSGPLNLAEAAQWLVNSGSVAVAASSSVLAEGTVVLAGGGLAMEPSVTFRRYQQSGGVLSGAGQIVVTGEFAWTGGEQVGTGSLEIAATASGSVSGGGLKQLLNGRRLINRTTLPVSTQYIYLGGYQAGGATLENHGTLQFINAPGLFWTQEDAANPVSFVNQGVVTIESPANGSVRLDVPLVNGGSIRILQGTVTSERNSQHSGSVQIDGPATLTFTAGSHVFEANSGLGGAGALVCQAGTVRFDTTLQLTGPIRASGGTATFNADQVFASLTQIGGLGSGSVISGSGSILITNQFVWNGGTLLGPGRLEVAATATTSLGTGAKVVAHGRVLVNRSLMELDEADLYLANNTDTPTRFENRGTFVLPSGRSILNTAWDGLKPVAFVNYGSMLKQGTNVAPSGVDVPWENPGVLQVQGGVLRMNQNGDHSGTALLSAGTRWEWFRGVHQVREGAQFTGDGLLTLTSGAAQMVVDANVELAVPFTMAAGRVAGTGQLTLLRDFLWTGGEHFGSGTTEIPAGVTATISTTTSKSLNAGRRLLNRGTMQLTANLIRNNTPAGGARWENEGLVEVSGTGGFVQGTADNTVRVDFVNTGTLRKTGTTDCAFAVPGSNSGRIEVLAGTLELSRDWTLSGVADVSSGATLELLGRTILKPEQQIVGVGRLGLLGPVTLEGPLNLGTLQVFFGNATAITGAFPISNEPGGEIRVDRVVTFPHDLVVGGSLVIEASDRLTVIGTATLLASGSINNSGILRVGVWNNQGGTYVGAPPQVVGLPEGFAQIKELRGVRTVSSLARQSAEPDLVLIWSAPSPAGYAIEASSDLIHWEALPEVPTQVTAEGFETPVTAVPGVTRFFRIRWQGN